MEQKHMCPWWLGYFLINPLRKYMHDPYKLLKAYLKPGMKVIDFGCAMGYFSLPMARMVGETGKVYCFDIQEKMLAKLVSRAEKSGLGKIVEPILINMDQSHQAIDKSADFALLFAVCHEVPDQIILFSELASMLKSGACLLFAEPKGHVSPPEFEKSVSIAEQAGFKKSDQLKISGSHSILLEKI